MKTTKYIANYRHLAGAMVIFLSNFAWAGIPVQQWTQASGARVSLVESPAIPMVDVQIDFDAGGRRDPAGLAGLAAMTAGQVSNGVLAVPGAPARDENALSEAWADLGASFGASAGTDRMSFTLRSLTYPDLLARAVALAAQQIGAPAFAQAEWLRDRERVKASLKEANTRPATQAQRAFDKAVFGDHPYGRETTEASLMRIGTDDMRALYARLISPCRAVVSIVGAVTRAQADAMAAQLLSQLPTGATSPAAAASTSAPMPAACAPLPPVPEVAPLAAPQELRLPFNSAQAHVLIGQPGYKRDDPDYFALTVGNYILGGGGFVSRLTAEVREKRGLSYSVYSYFAPGLHAGAFAVGLQTRPDQATQAVQVAREVLQKFVSEGPTPAELKAAKDYFSGSFALRIDTNQKLLGNISNMAWNHLPIDYLDTWTQQVEKVTVADIKAAFSRKLQPGKMVTVVVGGE